MTDETKNFIRLNLAILKGSLKEAGVVIGAVIDKENPETAKLVFLDKEKYINGEKDGVSVDFNEFNL